MQIFVPAWGWGGSEQVYNAPQRTKKFSSPLGDGLVREMGQWYYIIIKFSSPLGDGLVPGNSETNHIFVNFRPRVGMGWFCRF